MEWVFRGCFSGHRSGPVCLDWVSRLGAIEFFCWDGHKDRIEHALAQLYQPQSNSLGLIPGIKASFVRVKKKKKKSWKKENLRGTSLWMRLSDNLSVHNPRKGKDAHLRIAWSCSYQVLLGFCSQYLPFNHLDHQFLLSITSPHWFFHFYYSCVSYNSSLLMPVNTFSELWNEQEHISEWHTQCSVWLGNKSLIVWQKKHGGLTQKWSDNLSFI